MQGEDRKERQGALPVTEEQKGSTGASLQRGTRRAGISNEEGADQREGTMDPIEKLVPSGLDRPVIFFSPALPDEYETLSVNYWNFE